MHRIAAVIVLLCLAAPARAEEPLGARVDAIVEHVMKESAVPHAWVAVVKDGALAYSHVYGDARVGIRYPIASNSKQLVAAAALMLVEDGKLSLDDPVAKYLPDLTRAK